MPTPFNLMLQQAVVLSLRALVDEAAPAALEQSGRPPLYNRAFPPPCVACASPPPSSAACHAGLETRSPLAALPWRRARHPRAALRRGRVVLHGHVFGRCSRPSYHRQSRWGQCLRRGVLPCGWPPTRVAASGACAVFSLGSPVCTVLGGRRPRLRGCLPSRLSGDRRRGAVGRLRPPGLARRPLLPTAPPPPPPRPPPGPAPPRLQPPGRLAAAAAAGRHPPTLPGGPNRRRPSRLRRWRSCPTAPSRRGRYKRRTLRWSCPSTCGTCGWWTRPSATSRLSSSRGPPRWSSTSSTCACW